MKRIDIHLHCMGQERAALGQSQIPSLEEILGKVLPETDSDRGILMATPAQLLMEDTDGLHTAYAEANKTARALSEQHPDKLSWMCCLDPRDPELEDPHALYATLKEYQAAGAVGFGEAYAPLWIDAPEMQRVYRCLEELGMPILFHMAPAPGKGYGLADDPGLPRLEKMLKAYPGLTFIGHSQVFWSEIGQGCPPQLRAMLPMGKVRPGRVPMLLDNYPNLMCDLSALSGFNALVRDLAYTATFLERYQDRLMFGSDYLLPRFMVHTSALLDAMKKLGTLSPDAWEKICSGNAIRLFYRDGALQSSV